MILFIITPAIIAVLCWIYPLIGFSLMLIYFVYVFAIEFVYKKLTGNDCPPEKLEEIDFLLRKKSSKRN